MKWYNKVNRIISEAVFPIIAIIDPDHLTDNWSIRDVAEKFGYTIIKSEDPVLFRFQYESLYRQKRNNNEDPKLIIITDKSFDELPYDVKRQCDNPGINITISLSEEFPRLSYPIIKELDPSTYLKLNEINPIDIVSGNRSLSDNETIDFLFNNIFMMPDHMTSSKELFLYLIRIHNNFIIMPDYFARIVTNRYGEFVDISKDRLKSIIISRLEFYKFMQSQWELFIRNTGSSIIDFNNRDIKVYTASLFLEGALKPTNVDSLDGYDKSWAGIGLFVDEIGLKKLKLYNLTQELKKIISNIESYETWNRIANLWAEVQVLKYELIDIDDDLLKTIESIHNDIEKLFEDWILMNFNSLLYVPFASKPAMVHSIPEHLAYRYRKFNERIILLVMDGLSLEQWVLIREFIKKKLNNICFNEYQCYAWVPTITPVSRQAIFSGKMPIFFKDTISRTDKEKDEWITVWETNGVKRQHVKYIPPQKGKNPDILLTECNDSSYKIIGVVINIIDNIAHGANSGMGQVHNDINYWLRQGYFEKILENLLEMGFTIYLTSDHGNISAKGTGYIYEGSLVKSEGHRARIYDNQTLRDQAHKDNPETIAWPGYGLPKNFSILLPRGRIAFITKGEEEITHGGITLEEMIVPFVRISKEE